ncbi:MAG: hypothetical protein D8M57_13330 [Candidatus Scalindua sp. AMX11]|nr:MAG: hypothetical protein DWQ00_11760 [Candidatus Scalindua sp.]NOG83744.1 aromatic amino acid lyase [Planctomycetota bacterium]RZV82903.1 MAG: hypothetical protein EX341_08915 [Candidatus Scalindua sp. SCAELEC01]TDE64475.1 MAG: hypothetical protein D8M57_13330 [Candidatus Scalindua sp. AMX11]GJQ59804.1 MAG: hypothetical protein SCALA701_26050 [Candidatus Scalindua sp.]
MKSVVVNGEDLSITDIVRVARGYAKVSLGKEVRGKIAAAQKIVKRAIKDKQEVYGVTTGFGALSNVFISDGQRRELQRNIILSHSAGVGDPFEEETVRAIMLLRIQGLAQGHSVIRFNTVKTLVEMLNRGVHPLVPEKGSVGASGDLAPLAHVALVLIGEGKAVYKGKRLSGMQAMRAAHIPIIELDAGEGLSLVNGTQVMTGSGALTVYEAVRLLKTADIAAGMSLEVLLGSNIELNEKIHAARPHNGQLLSAENLRTLTNGSEIISSHHDCTRVQDAYSIRCCPQVHGASKDALGYAKNVVETEINSATGNPLIFAETGEIVSNDSVDLLPIST